MRTLTLLFALLVVAPAAAQDWTLIPIGTTQDLQEAERDQFGTVWIVGDSGYVFRSDATRTLYTRVDAGTAADLHAYRGSVNSSAMVSGEAGTFLYTVNGTSWSSRPLPDATQRYVIGSGGSGGALAAGSAGRLYRTSNNGVTWTEQSVPVAVPFHGVLGETTVVGDDGVLLVLTGGVWEPRATGTTSDLHAITSTGNNTQMAVGENGTLLRRDAAGVYSVRPSGTTATLRDVATTGQSANVVIAVGDGGTALKSTDGGATWCALATGTTADLLGVTAPTNAQYILAGAGGLVLRTTTGGGPCAPVVASEPDPGAAALQFSAAPNPARGAVSLAFTLTAPGPVRLALYDALGREVAVATESARPAGRHDVTLDTSRLAPGLYLARLTTAGGTAARRVAVLR